jgi:hypothetical protein
MKNNRKGLFYHWIFHKTTRISGKYQIII